MEELLAGLGARVFLMHNVHEEAPYPFSRPLGHVLPARASRPPADQAADGPRSRRKSRPWQRVPSGLAPAGGAPAGSELARGRPVLRDPSLRPARICLRGADEFFLRPRGHARGGGNYLPSRAFSRRSACATCDAKQGLDGERALVRLNPIDLELGEDRLSRRE